MPPSARQVPHGSLLPMPAKKASIVEGFFTRVPFDCSIFRNVVRHEASVQAPALKPGPLKQGILT